jgi:tetratricopeptide (TPR) repeat protein
MPDSDAPPPSSSRGKLYTFPLPKRNALDQDLKTTLHLYLQHAGLHPTTPANEHLLAPQPGWDELRVRLERDDLDHELALEERDLKYGKGSLKRLQALRNLHAMRTFERGDRLGAYAEWEALAEEYPHDPSHFLTRALFFASDDIETALKDITRAAERAPNNPEVFERRGSCFIRLGDWESAVPEYRRLVQLRPHNLEALKSLARALYFTSNPDAAIAIIERAIKLAPWRAEFYSFRASCFNSKKNDVEELHDLNRCLERDPKNIDALRSRANFHRRNKDVENEFADLSKIIEIDPSQAGTFRERASIYQTRGQLDLALADLSSAITLEPDNRYPREARAKIHYKMGALDLSAEDLDNIIAHDDAHKQYEDRWLWGINRNEDNRDWMAKCAADPYWLRGEVFRRLGDNERALLHYKLAKQIDPWRVDEVAQDLYARREWMSQTEQLDVLDTLVLLEPTNWEWWKERAKVLKELMRGEEALADINQYIVLFEYDHEAFHLRADIHISRGDLKSAIEDESKAIYYAPREASYYGWRGIYRLYEKGASDEAEADMKHAIELEPYELTPHRLFVIYLEKCERWEEIVDVYDTMVKIEPCLASTYAHRAETRLRQGNDEATLRAALADFDAALLREPNDAEVKAKREALLTRLETRAGW